MTVSPTQARALSARAASDRLTAALVALGAQGLRPPCSQPETHHYWLSEIDAERRQAAQWCRPCPVLTVCGQAAQAHDERHFVWGGVDRHRKPRNT